MQFSVSKSALVQGLALVSRVVEKRSTIPILTNVKLQADEGALTITATDLDVAMSVRVGADVKEPGATTIPGAKLFGYVRLLSEGDIKFKVDLETHWTTITVGRSRTRIAGIAADSFPEQPAAPATSLTVPAAALLALVNRTKIAISAEASRFTLNGALLSCSDGRLHLIATDGHRLAFTQKESDGEKVEFIVPLPAIKNLSALAEGADSIAIATDDNHLFFRSGEALLIARKISGNFPDYERVLPGALKNVITLNRTDLIGAISRVSQFADVRSRAIRLTLKDGALEIFSSAVESGESGETVECDYRGGDEVAAGFNAGYLLEFLTVLDCESVELRINDGKAAAELRPAGSDDYRYVVMPMRI